MQVERRVTLLNLVPSIGPSSCTVFSEKKDTAFGTANQNVEAPCASWIVQSCILHDIDVRGSGRYP